MSDRLDLALSQKRKIETDLLNRLKTVRDEIRVLEHAAALSLPMSQGGPQKPGRQKGAISNKWREVFRDMFNSNHANPYEEIAHFADKQGIEIEFGSLKQRVNHYVSEGFLERKDAGFWVTNTALNRFGITD